MRYTLKCVKCNVLNALTNQEIKSGIYICPICGITYKIGINNNKELTYRIVKKG